MLCTCIYFADIGSFDGEDMPAPAHDPGVDPDDDQGMPDVEDHQEADVERLAPAGAPVSPFARCGRLDARYRMELGDQLTALIIEAGIRPANMRYMQVDGRLLHIWRGMSCDMYIMMRHAVGATTLATWLRRTISRYRRGRDAAHE